MTHTDVDETVVREYLKDKVSRFEQPGDIRIVGSIPRNPAGKVAAKRTTDANAGLTGK